MKKISSLKKAIVLFAAILFGMASVQAATITVSSAAESAGVNYNTIQAAYNYIKDLGAGTPISEAYVIELQGTYDPTTEIYPISLTAIAGASALNNITIRPATGVKKVISNPDQTKVYTGITVPASSTSLVLPNVDGITTSMYVIGNGITTITKVSAIDAGTNTLTLATATPATAQVPAITSQTIYIGPSYNTYTTNSPSATGTKTIVFYGANYVTIDGVSRTDANTGLTIQNPNVISAQTIYFFGGASNNAIRECFIRGANISSSYKGNNPSDGNNAQIWFEGTGYGNSIENNDICDIASKPMPISFFCFLNSTSAANQVNTVNNNNIYNLCPGVSSTTGNVGVFNFPSSSSPNCAITNNRIFWSRATESIYKDFYIFGFGGSSAGSNNTIENNVVGGTDASNNGTVNFDFNKATFSVYNINDNTTFKGNTLKNLSITSNLAATFYGVRISANQPAKAPTDINAWTGNTIKNISIDFKSTTAQLVAFTIASNAAHPARNISDNEISNITQSCTTAGTQCVVRGIQITGTVPTAAFWNFSNNKIFNLTAGNTNSTAANTVVGLDVIASTATVEKNNIYNLVPITSSTIRTGAVYGIRNTAGNTTGTLIKNNIISIGTGVSNDAILYGINQAGTLPASAVVKYYNNSVYVGGSSGDNSTIKSYAFYSASAGTTSTTYDIKNNIFVNARLNGATPTATAKHYAFGFATASVIKSCDRNLYFASPLGFTGSLDKADLTEWQGVLVAGSDAASVNADPLFVDATAATPDLHISSSASPANQSGVLLSDVSADFAGAARADYTPTDLGAYVIAGSTAVEASTFVSKNVFSANNTIIFNSLSGSTAHVYSLSGQLMKSAVLNSDKESIAINAGMYIVKVAGENVKVLVK